jgi:hypothetical protein
MTNENAQLTKQMTNRMVMPHSVGELCRCGECVINHNNNHNNHKATREMSRQQTINDVKNKQDILFVCCHPLAETIKLTVANFWALKCSKIILLLPAHAVHV